jgi:DNA end-binding protein Ku
MRAVWKGSISFGLVNIPISLYAATQREELKFRLLRASDLSPVNYKRVAETDGKEVRWDQIVKGYEYEKDKFVVLKEEELKQVDVEATQTVDIIDFVSLSEINPMYFNKPYYMEPTKGGAKAYVLIRDALRDTGKVGIAKVVIKTRQYLAAVKPNESGLLLELMHFADELVSPEELHLPETAKIGKSELTMAKSLIGQMTDKWDPEKYKDDYRTAVLGLIEKKVQSGGKEVKAAPKAKEKSPTFDLLEVLRKSLGEQKSKSAGRAGAERTTTEPRSKRLRRAEKVSTRKRGRAVHA